MPSVSSKKDDSAKGFVGSVVKFSIPTFINVGLLGIALIIQLGIDPDIMGPVGNFINWTNSLMTIVVLGLDQALIRFYNEPPKGLDSKGLFRLCFYFSSTFLLIAGLIGSVFFQNALAKMLGIGALGEWTVPLLFFNVFFYLIARYFNVMFRMQMNVLWYGVETVLMQFFYRLFYLLGYWLNNPMRSMMLCSVLGLATLALVLVIMQRRTIKPKIAEFKSSTYKKILPYALAIAPTGILYTLNSSVIGSFLLNALGKGANGIYNNAYTLSNVVSMIQLGFAAFWGAYMFENYKTQKERIMKMHDMLNLAVLVFFAFLIAFQDIIFIIFPKYSEAQTIFPLMMLAAVFTILCETTVYGNAIAKRPIFDTIGIGLAFTVNVVGCVLLVTTFGFGLTGAAIALALGNGAMYIMRTITAQRLYRTIRTPAKSIAAIVLAVALTVLGTIFAGQFLLKLLCCITASILYCIMYRKELIRGWRLVLSTVRGLLHRA